MSKTTYHSTSFAYDDLTWPESRINKVRQEAKAFCKQHNGELEHLAGKPNYWSNGDAFYADPSCLPKFVVYWEETMEEVA